MAERFERLNALIFKVLSKSQKTDEEKAALTKQIADGAWGSGESGRGGAPYRFETKKDGTRRLVITDPVDGDSVGASGKTIEEALSALEAKLA